MGSTLTLAQNWLRDFVSGGAGTVNNPAKSDGIATLADIDTRATNLEAATANGVVGTSGNQTIAGVMTFSVSPEVPDAPADTHSAINTVFLNTNTPPLYNFVAGVACVATGNITLSGEHTIDGVTTSGSRVGVVGQTTQSQNGIYVSASGAWARSADATTAAQLGRIAFTVLGGTTYVDTAWGLSLITSAITVGTTALVFSGLPWATGVAAETARAEAAEAAIATTAAPLISIAPYGGQWALVDGSAAGLAAITVDDTGTISVPNVNTPMLNGQPTAMLPSAANKGYFQAEIVHLPSYGQSLSVGQGGLWIQTSAQLYDSLMFTAGVRVQDGTGTDAANHAAFIPLIEVVNSLSANGETPCGNCFATIKSRLLAENSLAYSQQSFQLLGSAPGVENETIAELSKSSVGYTQLIDDITYGFNNAQTLGKTFCVGAVLWSQGESDYVGATSYATYLSELNTLYSNLNTDIVAITKQHDPVRMIMYQTMIPTYSPSTVALAMSAAAAANPNIIIACPEYAVPSPLHYGADNVHLSGPGYALVGAYYALAYKRIVIDGLPWTPLQPIAAHAQGALIIVRFDVPVLPLAFDTTIMPAEANYGFSLVDSSGNPLTVSAVSISEPDTIKITAAAVPPSGARVQYAFNADASGNLRDSQGNVIDAGLKLKWPLHNWCVAFDLAIT